MLFILIFILVVLVKVVWVVIMVIILLKHSLICILYSEFESSCRKPVVYKTKWPGIKLIYDFPLLYFPFSQWKKAIAKLLV